MVGATVGRTRERVERWFRERAGRLGLRAEAVRARYVLNWGGFVNQSFTVTDGAASYHLKLAGDASHRRELRRWYELRRLLAERYRAPAILEWIKIPAGPGETAHSGLLFRHVEGHGADFAAAPWLLREVAQVVQALHADRGLADRLRAQDGDRSHLDCFLETYVRRFRGDLVVIARDRPPFVSPATVAWMRAETRRLAALARASAAFAGPAEAPVHGDLQPNNVLVADGPAAGAAPCTGAVPSDEAAARGGGVGSTDSAARAGPVERVDWFLLDWDDLALGDPALDYSVLFWPLAPDDDPAFWRDLPLPAMGEAARRAFDERLALYARARLLDGVIDVLADYVEAEAAPEHAELVRAAKREEHLAALDRYRVTYG